MDIPDYLYFLLVSLTIIAFVAGIWMCFGIYKRWKKSEHKSCYVAIAGENSPLLSSCADPCVFGCAVCKDTGSIGSSALFSPAYRTPGSKSSNKVLVTSGGFPIKTPLLGTGSSSRSKFGSTNSTKRSSKKSLKKFTLIRDYTPETYDNEAHCSRISQPASDMKNKISDLAGATACLSNNAETSNDGINSNQLSQIIQAEVHPRKPSDACSTMVPLVTNLDLISSQEKLGATAYSSRTTDDYSSKHTMPGTLEVSECTEKEVFTPTRYGTRSYPNQSLRALSSSSDYARSSSADNSWELSSGSITCAIESSSSPVDRNSISLSPIRKGNIQYVVRDGKGFFTSDTSAFSSVPL